jgi:hypothetical protein
VLAALFLVALLFPGSGIRINDKITLHFMTLDEILSPDSVPYADITSILNNSRAIDDSAYLALLEAEPDQAPAGDTIRADEECLKMLTHPIEYPGSDSTLLYPFFRKMRRLNRSHDKLRIMHYGDSQIEGDRITSFIRFKLQERFGGSGIGMQPAVSLYGYQLSLKHTTSDGWLRYTAFGNVDSTLAHNRYGILGSFARFSPYPDSIPGDAGNYRAWITLESSRRAYRVSRNFSMFRLFYGNAVEPVFFELYSDGELFDADYLEVTDGLRVQTWSFDDTPAILNLKFESACSPDIYGIALDDEHGICVDNVPLRGSAGLVFSRMDPGLLKKMYKDLNVKLILLQFGGNVVPYISDNAAYYEKWFYRELMTLKSIVPDLSIIVIGVADMSVRDKDRYVTYPSLEHVRDALRSAALRADCAFWDMYAAMGGRNSMPSWVFADPPLASTDFVHFNERGARVLAEMFYNAFMNDYQAYISSRN